MNTKILVASLFALALVSASVMALYSGDYPLNLYLTHKDPATWNPVQPETWARVARVGDNTYSITGKLLQPNRAPAYTLIYYGDETHNDVWPYATCIKDIFYYQSNGNIYTRNFQSGLITELVEDGSVNEKLWLVPTADVDCEAGQMTAWNPALILFEAKLI